MKKQHIDDFVRGWLIGNFAPALFKTEQFEVGVLTHKKAEVWPKHYHAIQTEYNLLLKGKMKVKNQVMSEGDIFVFEPGEIADPEFLEDCQVLCIKVPSIPKDKYEVL